jgi:hypothetical protein
MSFLDFEYQMRKDPIFRDKIIKSVDNIVKTHKDMHKSLKHKEAYKSAIQDYLNVSQFNLAPLLAYYYPNYPDGPYTLKDFPFAHCYYQLNLGEGSYTVLRGSRQIGKCVSKNTNIKIRNKKTGEILTMPIGEFHEKIKNS